MMGDLDISLIQEFAIRPAFYDKTSPHYKDKGYVERAWLEISHKLGYNVSLLKDRMYQLRNRYNLEKRKVETMRMEGQPNPKSSWPLFSNLTFLDGHIRPRKSYKSMMKRSSGKHEDDYYEEPPVVEIKFEQDGYQNGYETEDDTTAMSPSDENFINPSNLLVNIDDTESENDPSGDGVTPQTNNSKSQNGVGHIRLRNINSLKRSMNMDDLTSAKMAKYCTKVHQTSDKFKAFGSFLTSSLLDMPEKKALELVEKFTNDIVKALLEK